VRGFSSIAFKELLALAGYYLPWNEADLVAFDDLLRSYRRLSLIDQIVLRGRLLWHILESRRARRAMASSFRTLRRLPPTGARAPFAHPAESSLGAASARVRGARLLEELGVRL